MALIDVDRHILSEITQYNNKKKEQYRIFTEQWAILLDSAERGDTLYWTETINGDEKKEKLKKSRKKFFSAVHKISKSTIMISVYEAKQEALMLHLVSLVSEFDTQNGTETGTIEEIPNEQ